MRGFCKDFLAIMPEITVFMNCDTRLAINLRMFDIGENDEFIFTIKNYSYLDSPYVFLFRARKRDMDANGEVIFKIPPKASKYLKPSAFYNFAVLRNMFDPRQETEYKKLTGNGAIILEYGAHDLDITTSDVPEQPEALLDEILDIHLELVNEDKSGITGHSYKYEIQDVRLELIDEAVTPTVTLQDISRLLKKKL